MTKDAKCHNAQYHNAKYHNAECHSADMLMITLLNGTTHFKKCKNGFNTIIYSYLETPGCQSSNLYLNVVHFLTPVVIRHLWQLKRLVLLHCCLIGVVLLKNTVYLTTDF